MRSTTGYRAEKLPVKLIKILLIYTYACEKQLQSAIAQMKVVLFCYGILVQLSLINETKTEKIK